MAKLHFDDLTAITCPFGLLDDDTQARLKAHGGPYEFFRADGWFDWSPAWAGDVVYRVKPAPLTKPSIDWSHVAPEWKWLARDDDGMMWLYEWPQPDCGVYSWKAHGRYADASAFASLTPGMCDWRDSLVRRPEGV